MLIPEGRIKNSNNAQMNRPKSFARVKNNQIEQSVFSSRLIFAWRVRESK